MTETCSYLVDGDNILVAVGGSWNRFALENDAPELVAPATLSRSLFEFISDRTTAALYFQVLAQVRIRQSPQAFDIRCDSPRMRRYLHITFTPVAWRGVAIESRMVRQERRDVVHLLERDARRGSGLLESCSWCERVNAMGEWLEIEEAVTRLQLFGDADIPGLTHGICEPCMARIEGELASA